MRKLLIFLFASLALPTAVNAFCSKNIKSELKKRKKLNEKFKIKEKACKETKEFEISRFERVHKGKNLKNSSVPQLSDKFHLKLIELKYESCMRQINLGN